MWHIQRTQKAKYRKYQNPDPANEWANEMHMQLSKDKHKWPINICRVFNISGHPENEIENTLRLHFITIRMAIVKKVNSSKD